MVLDAVSNFVRGNTDAEVGTSDTTVSVADASIFPDPETDGEFNVVIWDVNNFPRPDQDGDVEILRVTERDTTADELTVTRGQEMTSAAAHPEGSAIHLSPTAKMFSDIESTFGDFWDAGTQELTADVNNTNTTTTALEAEDTNTKRINAEGHHYASGYDGADEDERLSNALAEASRGDVIYLENNSRYESDPIFPQGCRIVGNSFRDFGARIDSGQTWTTSNDANQFEYIRIEGNLEINDERCNVSNASEGDITVDDNDCLLNMLHDITVTFESNTSGGMVGVRNDGTTITDNGNNEILTGA